MTVLGTNKEKFIQSRAFKALAALTIILIANLDALVDALLHPEIPYFDEEHLIIGGVSSLLAGVFLTALLRYGERLKTSEKGLWTILDSINSGAMIIDPESHTIIHANSAALKMIGADEKAVLGKVCHGFVCPAEACKCPITDLGQKIDLSERVLIRANGEKIQILKSASPVTYGGKTYLCESFTDITGIKKADSELRRRHEELIALYSISSTINHSIAVERLLPDVLETITDLDILNIQKKGGILLVEGDTLRLAHDIGHTSDSFAKDHASLKLGECLCGIAAETGEIIISKNSHGDSRHSIEYDGMSPHGHVIIPLKARGRVAGVLYLYLPPDADLDPSTLSILIAMGNHIGLAIENARLFEETKALSLRDPLTGLANRRLLGIQIEKSAAKAQRYGAVFSVIMADIDGFKGYNDFYGHSAGDKLLKEIACIVAAETRETDLAVRYGGEEFLVLMPLSELRMACACAERIRSEVEVKTSVTISLGVAEYAKEMTAEDVINCADEALYKAKQRGKNRVEAAPLRNSIRYPETRP